MLLNIGVFLGRVIPIDLDSEFYVVLLIREFLHHFAHRFFQLANAPAHGAGRVDDE